MGYTEVDTKLLDCLVGLFVFERKRQLKMRRGSSMSKPISRVHISNPSPDPSPLVRYNFSTPDDDISEIIPLPLISSSLISSIRGDIDTLPNRKSFFFQLHAHRRFIFRNFQT